MQYSYGFSSLAAIVGALAIITPIAQVHAAPAAVGVSVGVAVGAGVTASVPTASASVGAEISSIIAGIEKQFSSLKAKATGTAFKGPISSIDKAFSSALAHPTGTAFAAEIASIDAKLASVLAKPSASALAEDIAEIEAKLSSLRADATFSAPRFSIPTLSAHSISIPSFSLPTHSAHSISIPTALTASIPGVTLSGTAVTISPAEMTGVVSSIDAEIAKLLVAKPSVSGVIASEISVIKSDLASVLAKPTASAASNEIVSIEAKLSSFFAEATLSIPTTKPSFSFATPTFSTSFIPHITPSSDDFLLDGLLSKIAASKTLPALHLPSAVISEEAKVTV